MITTGAAPLEAVMQENRKNHPEQWSAFTCAGRERKHLIQDMAGKHCYLGVQAMVRSRNRQAQAGDEKGAE